jgi:radical SAM protein with 4Fe4S-binding SPASM domain
MILKVREKAWELYRKIEQKEHNLQYLFFEITKKCNLNCLHCGSDCKADHFAPELTTESWLKIVDYVKNHFGNDVVFVISGGEPLIHPDIFTIGRHIADSGMKWGMVTNGMALDEKCMDNLINSGIYSITVSVDGTESSHNHLRNSSMAFKCVQRALKLIGQSPIEMKDAVTCVYPANLHELDKVAEILINHKIPAWRLFRIFPNGRAKHNQELHLSVENTNKMVEWIAGNREHYKKKGLNVSASCEGFLPFKQDVAVRDFPFFCRAGINIAGILSDGTITGCTNNHEGFAQGNILKDDLATVWETKFEDFRKREWVKQTTCKSCKYLKKCQGGSIHLWQKGKDSPEFCYVSLS